MLLALQRAVMVHVVEQPVDETTVADVLLGTIGLTMALIIAAVVLGGLFGALLIGIKKTREKYQLDRVPDSEALKIT